MSNIISATFGASRTTRTGADYTDLKSAINEEVVT